MNNEIKKNNNILQKSGHYVSFLEWEEGFVCFFFF